MARSEACSVHIPTSAVVPHVRNIQTGGEPILTFGPQTTMPGPHIE